MFARVAANVSCAENSDISALKCCVEADRSRDNLALAAIEPICLPPLNYCSRRAKKNAVSKLSQTFAITLFSRTQTRVHTTHIEILPIDKLMTLRIYPIFRQPIRRYIQNLDGTFLYCATETLYVDELFTEIKRWKEKRTE